MTEVTKIRELLETLDQNDLEEAEMILHLRNEQINYFVNIQDEIDVATTVAATLRLLADLTFAYQAIEGSEDIDKAVETYARIIKQMIVKSALDAVLETEPKQYFN